MIYFIRTSSPAPQVEPVPVRFTVLASDAHGSALIDDLRLHTARREETRKVSGGESLCPRMGDADLVPVHLRRSSGELAKACWPFNHPRRIYASCAGQSDRGGTDRESRRGCSLRRTRRTAVVSPSRAAIDKLAALRIFMLLAKTLPYISRGP